MAKFSCVVECTLHSSKIRPIWIFRQCYSKFTVSTQTHCTHTSKHTDNAKFTEWFCLRQMHNWKARIFGDQVKALLIFELALELGDANQWRTSLQPSWNRSRIRDTSSDWAQETPRPCALWRAQMFLKCLVSSSWKTQYLSHFFKHTCRIRKTDVISNRPFFWEHVRVCVQGKARDHHRCASHKIVWHTRGVRQRQGAAAPQNRSQIFWERKKFPDWKFPDFLIWMFSDTSHRM